MRASLPCPFKCAARATAAPTPSPSGFSWVVRRILAWPSRKSAKRSSMNPDLNSQDTKNTRGGTRRRRRSAEKRPVQAVPSCLCVTQLPPRSLRVRFSFNSQQQWQQLELLPFTLQTARLEGLQFVDDLRQEGPLQGVGQESALEAHDDECLDLLEVEVQLIVDDLEFLAHGGVRDHAVIGVHRDPQAQVVEEADGVVGHLLHRLGLHVAGGAAFQGEAVVVHVVQQVTVLDESHAVADTMGP